MADDAPFHRNKTDFRDFCVRFGGLLKHLRERDFEFPIHFCVVATNGAIYAGSYELEDPESLCFPSLEAKFLAKGSITVFRLPLNVMFVDAKGKSACVIFDGSELDEFEWR